MKIGIITLLWTGGFGEADFPLLGRIKGWGFDLVEVSRFDFDAFPAAKVRRAVLFAGDEPAGRRPRCERQSPLPMQLVMGDRDAGRPQVTTPPLAGQHSRNHTPRRVASLTSFRRPLATS
jgi:hypothetical protein